MRILTKYWVSLMTAWMKIMMNQMIIMEKTGGVPGGAGFSGGSHLEAGEDCGEMVREGEAGSTPG
jgi:hypothetical protein